MWKDPMKTAFLYITLNFFFVLVVFLGYSFITIITSFFAFFLAIGVFIHVFWTLLGSDAEREK